MKRSAPLRRHTRIRAKRPRRLDRPGADPAYLAFVREFPCVAGCVLGSTPCRGRIEASHVTTSMGVRGTGLKMPDRSAVPHCSKHHREWEERRGTFAGWTKTARMEQAVAWVAGVQLWATPLDLEQGRTLEALGLGHLVCHDGRWSWVPGPDTRERAA